MGWQDMIGSMLTAGATGDPLAFKKNKMQEMMQQFQMQQQTEDLQMKKAMFDIESKKIAEMQRQQKSEEEQKQRPGYAIFKAWKKQQEGEELDPGEPVPTVADMGWLSKLGKEQDDEYAPIPGTTALFTKRSGKVKETGIAKEKEEKAPTVRSFTEGDKTVDRQWNPQTQKWEEIGSGPRYKPPQPDKPDKGPTAFQLNKTATDYRKEFNNLPEIKEHNSIQPKLKSMEAAYQESKTTKNYIAVDQAMITLFNKLSDPSSVVRESEYARMAQNLPFVNALKGKVAKVMKGGAGLTDNDRDNIMTMAKLMKQAYDEVYNVRADEYRGYGTIVGANPDLIAKPSKTTKTIVERRKTASGKTLVKYSDGSIGEE